MVDVNVVKQKQFVMNYQAADCQCPHKTIVVVDNVVVEKDEYSQKNVIVRNKELLPSFFLSIFIYSETNNLNMKLKLEITDKEKHILHCVLAVILSIANGIIM
jgi:hypothetical protein